MADDTKKRGKIGEILDTIRGEEPKKRGGFYTQQWDKMRYRGGRTLDFLQAFGGGIKDEVTDYVTGSPSSTLDDYARGHDAAQVERNRAAHRILTQSADKAYDRALFTPGTALSLLDPDAWSYRRQMDRAMDFARENPVIMSEAGVIKQQAKRDRDFQADREEFNKPLVGASDTQIREARREARAEAAKGRMEMDADMVTYRAATRARIKEELRRKGEAGRRDAEQFISDLEKPDPTQPTPIYPDAQEARERLATRTEGRQALAADMGRMFSEKGRLTADDLATFSERGSELALSDKDLQGQANRLNIQARQGLANDMITMAKQGEFTHQAMADFAAKGERFGLTKEDIAGFAKKNALVPREVGRADSIKAQNAMLSERTDGRQLGTLAGKRRREIRRNMRDGIPVSARQGDQLVEDEIATTGIRSEEEAINTERRARKRAGDAANYRDESEEAANKGSLILRHG